MGTEKLGNLAEIKTGYQARGALKEDDNGNIAVIQLKNTGRDRILNKDEFSRISLEKEPTQFLVTRGDILITARGSDNYAVWIDEDLRNTIAISHFFIIRIKSPEITPGYLTAYLNLIGPSLFERIREGTTVPKINRSRLLDMNIKMPDLKKQMSLEKIYREMLRQDEILRLLRHKKKSMMQAVLMENFY